MMRYSSWVCGSSWLLTCLSLFIFFFMHKTAYVIRISDWSSDVCSSDLLYSGSTLLADTVGGHSAVDPRLPALAFLQSAGRPDHLPRGTIITTRSEERSVGKECVSTCSSRGSAYH